MIDGKPARVRKKAFLSRVDPASPWRVEPHNHNVSFDDIFLCSPVQWGIYAALPMAAPTQACRKLTICCAHFCAQQMEKPMKASYCVEDS